jgi:hypothetical protein
MCYTVPIVEIRFNFTAHPKVYLLVFPLNLINTVPMERVEVSLQVQPLCYFALIFRMGALFIFGFDREHDFAAEDTMHIIDEKLQQLVCPLSLFVPITGGLIGRTRLTAALRNPGDEDLDRNLVDKLVALLDEMAELKRTSLVAPDWSDTLGIREQLKQRRLFRETVKYDSDNVRKLLGDNNGANETTVTAMDERNSSAL